MTVLIEQKQQLKREMCRHSKQGYEYCLKLEHSIHKGAVILTRTHIYANIGRCPTWTDAQKGQTNMYTEINTHAHTYTCACAHTHTHTYIRTQTLCLSLSLSLGLDVKMYCTYSITLVNKNIVCLFSLSLSFSHAQELVYILYT